MLSGEGNENGEKTTIHVGLISKKTTLHVQHTFQFVHFFAVILYDHSEKIPETSQLHVLWRKCRTCCCSLFFTRSFSPWWPLGFLIFAAKKISCCSSNEQLLIFRSSSLSLFFSLSFAGLSPTLFFLYISNLWT